MADYSFVDQATTGDGTVRWADNKKSLSRDVPKSSVF